MSRIGMNAFYDLAVALGAYHVVLEPDRNESEWWAGAPSVTVAPDGTFFLAARMREGDSPRGKRGYEIRLLESRDGVEFRVIGRIPREELGVPGVERPALVIDEQSGRYRLYGCAGTDEGWFVFRLDDAGHPSQLDPRTMRPVLKADDTLPSHSGVLGYKDPFVIRARSAWHMFVIAGDRVERIGHFTSENGEMWIRAGQHPVMENSGWHNFYTRPACVLPLSIGYLFVYEGSRLDWHDPVYNIATGLAYTPDLAHVIDLTPDEPALLSTTPGPFHTWRYSQWVVRGDRLFVYFEAARPNNTNELRVAVVEAGSGLFNVA